MLSSYICALDIGSSKIAGVLAEIKKGRIVNIYIDSMPTKGIKRGIIVDSIALLNSINKVLKNLKDKSGINIKFIYANISGQDIITKHSHAIIPLAERGNKVITTSDIQKANEQARILGSDLEEEIIQEVPFSYAIDYQSDISNPLGLYSHRLGVDLYLICAKVSSLQSFSRVIRQAGYDLRNLFFSGLATSKIIFSKEYTNGIGIFCDIGSDITEVLIFKDGRLQDIEILLMGGDDLSMQLEESLKIPFELAEDVKRSYGIVGDYDLTEKDKEILIRKGDVYKPIKQKLVCEILTSKAKSMCQTIKDAIEKKIDLNEVSGFFVIGRTVLLDGFLEILENNLGISARLGRINEPDMLPLVNENNDLSGHKYLNYLTALGIISTVIYPKRSKYLTHAACPHNPIIKIIDRVKEVYQEYF